MVEGTSLSGTSEVRRGQRVRRPPAILALFLAASLAIWAAAGFAVLHLRSLALTQAETNLRNLNRAIAAHTEAALLGADLVLRGIRDEIEENPGADDTEVQRILDRLSSGATYLRAVSLVSADGRLRVVSHQPPPAQAVTFSDRQWFIDAARTRSREMAIDEPIKSRLSGLWLIPLVFAVEGPDGAFAGAVMGSLDPEFFRNEFKAFDLGEGAAITLQRTDSLVLAREPFSEDLIGRSFPSGPIYRTVKDQGHGVSRGLSAIDGQQRLMSGYAIARFPVYVAISVTEESVLKPWRTQAAIVMSGAAALFLLIAFLCLAHFRLKRQMAGRQEVEKRLGEQMAVLQSTSARLEAQAKELARSNAELEQFAYVASHDLREPLRMVSSFLGLVERRLGATLDAETKEFIDFAVDGAHRMDRLILDLLQYSRIGRLTEPKRRVAVGDAVKLALDYLKVAIDETRPEIVIPEQLPTVLASEEELVRLFQNLIGNALKYRRPEVAPHIVVTVERGHGEWEFAVADNGIGIPPDQCERVFGIFKRLHPSSRYEGTGIGLAVCKKIVEAHGGRIWATSDGEGRGSTFRFTLPAE